MVACVVCNFYCYVQKSYPRPQAHSILGFIGKSMENERGIFWSSETKRTWKSWPMPQNNFFFVNEKKATKIVKDNMALLFCESLRHCWGSLSRRLSSFCRSPDFHWKGIAQTATASTAWRRAEAFRRHRHCRRRRRRCHCCLGSGQRPTSLSHGCNWNSAMNPECIWCTHILNTHI